MEWIYGIHVFKIKPTMWISRDSELSVYRNVLVVWDEDLDTRVLGWIDDQPPEVLDNLILVSEHEGGVCLLWKSCIPHGYEQNETTYGPDGDAWTIHESVVNRDPRYEY